MPVRSVRPSVAVLAIVAALALFLGGCTRITGPRQWTETAELVSGGSFVIDVRDTSGRIDNVEIDPTGVQAPGGVANPTGQPNVLLVPWTGGACDRRTDISISANGAGLAIAFQTTVSPQACDAIGVGHLLRLTSSQPIAPAQVRVSTAPPVTG